MKVELTKEDLKSLVMGTSPYYSVFEVALVKNNGSYTGGFVERWDWNLNDKLTENQLWDLYVICRDSWK